MKVLVVCSGNICRSPLVAALLRDHLGRAGTTGIDVASAGLLGIEGAPASPEAVRVASEMGIDLSAHASRGLRPAEVAGADWVVAMTREHLSELSRDHPPPLRGTLLLRAFETAAEPAPRAPDLADPLGEDLAFYRRQADVVRRCVQNLASYLAAEAARPAS